MKEVFDFLFGGFPSRFAVPCPQNLIDDFNDASLNETLNLISTTTIATTTTTKQTTTISFHHEIENFGQTFIFNHLKRAYYGGVGGILFIIMLSLNRKKFINSQALRLFTNYYLAFILFDEFYSVLDYIYYYLFWLPSFEKNIWCVEVYPSYQIQIIKNKAYRTFYNTSLIIFAVHLLVFKITGRLNFVTLEYETFYDNFTESVTILLVISHFIITVFSLQTVIKFRNSTNSEVQEFKSFLGFSLFPTFLSILQQVLSCLNGYSWISRFLDIRA